MPNRIVPIVEGHGEIEAAPLLIRRVLQERFNEYGFQVSRVKRLKRHRIQSDLPKMLHLAALDAIDGAIIVLVDADRCCAQELAAEMSQIAEEQNLYCPVAIVCPNAEFEAWFIASIDTMRGEPIGRREAIVESSANCPANVEDIRDAKGWLSEHMLGNMVYKPTQDQAPLAAMIDIELASNRSRSFKRLCHAVEEVVVGIRSGTASVTPPASP